MRAVLLSRARLLAWPQISLDEWDILNSTLEHVLGDCMAIPVLSKCKGVLFERDASSPESFRVCPYSKFAANFLNPPSGMRHRNCSHWRETWLKLCSAHAREIVRQSTRGFSKITWKNHTLRFQHGNKGKCCIPSDLQVKSSLEYGSNSQFSQGKSLTKSRQI
jgi:hypothetical protein